MAGRAPVCCVVGNSGDSPSCSVGVRGPTLTPPAVPRPPTPRYTFPHAKISTAPPVMNRVFGQTVDAQLQVGLVVRGGGKGRGRSERD